jgi:ankyrin repeat protein
VIALIDLGADVNMPGDLGYTPLHYSAMKGRWQIADLLMRCGARADMKNEFDETAVDIARLGGHTDFVARFGVRL